MCNPLRYFLSQYFDIVLLSLPCLVYTGTEIFLKTPRYLSLSTLQRLCKSQISPKKTQPKCPVLTLESRGDLEEPPYTARETYSFP